MPNTTATRDGSVPPNRIVLEFMNGRSIVGLARKYGMTKLEVEAVLRRALK